MPRLMLFLLAVLLSSAALAQGRLNPPNYYLSQLTELKPGDAVNGALSEASGQNFKDGSYLDLYVLYGEEGEDVTLVAASLEFDTYLSLYDPNGWLVAAVDDGVYSSDAELSVTLPQTGRYLIVVSGYSDYDLGRYTLSRSAARQAPETEALALDVPGAYSGTFNESTAATVPYLASLGVLFVMEVTETTHIDVRASAAEFDTFLIITNENGDIVVENDDENYSEASGWNTNSRAFAEYEPGVYYVYLTSLYSTPLGDYSLSVRRFAAID
ncbi:MAG: PPC domain-containing protein [Trueperaceae bacterium]